LLQALWIQPAGTAWLLPAAHSHFAVDCHLSFVCEKLPVRQCCWWGHQKERIKKRKRKTTKTNQTKSLCSNHPLPYFAHMDHRTLESFQNQINKPIPPCSDFIEFKDWLKDIRRLDDSLIFFLNKADNSPAQCEEIWKNMLNIYRIRNNAIRNCILAKQSEVDELSKTQASSIRISTVNHQLGFLKTELGVEDILRNQGRALTKSKCGGFRPTLDDSH
jgi:hypothetical protein